MLTHFLGQTDISLSFLLKYLMLVNERRTVNCDHWIFNSALGFPGLIFENGKKTFFYPLHYYFNEKLNVL
jgi:hypothetical protein